MSYYPKTLSGRVEVETADALTIADVIVPDTQFITFQYSPLATITEYDLMVAPRALKVVSIKVVPSTLQGGALTGTIVKATGTATPANGTTPMHTANAINFNTGAMELSCESFLTELKKRRTRKTERTVNASPGSLVYRAFGDISSNDLPFDTILCDTGGNPVTMQWRADDLYSVVNRLSVEQRRHANPA